MQRDYGFLYLGELLERYEERFGMTLPDRRAIALALGYTKDIVTPEMFVGSQRGDFIQSVRRYAENDVYLTGALYLIHGGESGAVVIENHLREWAYTKTEELIFAMSLFSDPEQALSQFSDQLITLLGKGRTLPVFGNTDIFNAAFAMLFPLKKRMKARRMDLLRALLSLPVSYVKEDSKHHAWLLEHGYTPVEIVYANTAALCSQCVPEGPGRNSITAEKLIVGLFRTVLANDKPLPAEVYPQLSQVYQMYSTFDVKCYGEHRLVETLKGGLRIQTPETMAWFIRCSGEALHPATINFDIMDSKWDSMAESLGEEHYQRLFESCLTEEMDAAQVQERLDRYHYFAEDGDEYFRLLSLVLQRLETAAADRFLHHWRENNCALSELERMERRTRTAPAEDLDKAMGSYTGYINLIYGSRFQNISLYGLAGFQENLLIYAITHDKKHFIRLVDEHTDQFLGLSRWSILFHEPLYRAHFNLNELTAKDLKDCGWMTTKGLPTSLLAGDHQYTFAELKLLYNVPDSYTVLYSKLRTPKLDDRIKVLRQLRKRNVLHEIASEEELTTLAQLLDQKPLADWRREELGHIRDIRAEDAAQLLIHLDRLRPLLPGIRCQADVMLVLRSLEHIERFDSVDALKANLLEVDQDWQTLANDMELSPAFKTRYQEDIVKFLCRDGAGIARTYLDCLNPELHPAFHRVVKAELMGQFSDLKYHTGDLEQELDYPLDTQAKVEWKHNLSLTQGSTEIWERDDFFSTMLLGTLPQETCLSYRDGAYCSCLLACFDSNKKVLYAEKDGRIVGRACIRLTKCCLNGAAENRKGPAGKFSFVDLEAASGSPEDRHQDERLALFLEHPYSSGLNLEDVLQMKALFVKLVRQKAEMLGAQLVLSLDYREVTAGDFAQTSLHLYISASKAGGQYLDSLGGKAEVSSEGSYKKNIFLVKQAKNLPGGADETLCA